MKEVDRIEEERIPVPKLEIVERIVERDVDGEVERVVREVRVLFFSTSTWSRRRSWKSY